LRIEHREVLNLTIRILPLVSWNHQSVRGRSHSARINGDRGAPIGYTSRSITCHSANRTKQLFSSISHSS